MKNFVLVAVILVASAVLCAQAMQAMQDRRFCYGKPCPHETVECERIQRTIDNRKRIRTEVLCLGVNRTILNSSEQENRNPLGPMWNFEGISISEVTIVPSGNSTDSTSEDSSDSSGQA
ncbi:hypothetical protein MTP99_008330 [Tenebrio molitor]|nr:hypothetical protein MTP99_008330 [Tenebrio molitor]